MLHALLPSHQTVSAQSGDFEKQSTVRRNKMDRKWIINWVNLPKSELNISPAINNIFRMDSPWLHLHFTSWWPFRLFWTVQYGLLYNQSLLYVPAVTMGPHLAYHVSKSSIILRKKNDYNCFLFEKYEFKMFSLTCLVTKIIQAFHSHNHVCKKAYQLYEFNKKIFLL